jgi:preprotein translocase subunit SecA
MQALAEAVDGLLATHCSGDYTEQWDLEALVADTNSYWPTSLTPEGVGAASTSDEVYDLLMGDATRHYEQREAELGTDSMRDIERQVMLKIIDARWRDHLKEMDYLQEGINLRALGQKDPLSEWQREGFEMFGGMMKGIAQDFVRYVMHVQVVEKDQDQPKLGAPRVLNMQTSSSDDRPDESGFDRAAAQVAADDGVPAPAQPTQTAKPKTVQKDAFEKTPRNAPCPCGSGKKFKNCHGAS